MDHRGRTCKFSSWSSPDIYFDIGKTFFLASLQLKRWLDENTTQGGKSWLRFDPMRSRYYCHKRSIPGDLQQAASDLLQDEPSSLAAIAFGRLDSSMNPFAEGDSVAVTGKRGRAAAERVSLSATEQGLPRARLLVAASGRLAMSTVLGSHAAVASRVQTTCHCLTQHDSHVKLHTSHCRTCEPSRTSRLALYPSSCLHALSLNPILSPPFRPFRRPSGFPPRAPSSGTSSKWSSRTRPEWARGTAAPSTTSGTGSATSSSRTTSGSALTCACSELRCPLFVPSFYPALPFFSSACNPVPHHHTDAATISRLSVWVPFP